MIFVSNIQPVLIARTAKLRKTFRDGSCYMVSDFSDQELIDFGLKIGLKKSWLQSIGQPNCHFDLTRKKRKLAIENGARKSTLKEIVKIIKNKGRL